jgi:Nif-specific regulatory protein
MNEYLNDTAVETRMPIDELKEIRSWVSSIQNVDKTLELIIKSASRFLNAKAASLLLLDQKSKELYFKVATGSKGREIKEFRIKPGQGIAGHVASKGEPLLIPDVTQDTR